MSRKLTEDDPDDAWQATVAVPIGSVSTWSAGPQKKTDKKKKNPIGFDIRPGVHRKPLPHETWGEPMKEIK